MKILIVNQFFWPDVAATGQLLTDLTRHLGTQHEVTVVCSSGAYEEQQNPLHLTDRPPVKIVHVPGLSFKRNALGRLISYLTFFIGSILCVLRAPRQDLIVTMTTPPLLGIVGRVVKSLRGTRHYIWEMDMFPDVFVSLGALSERSLITRFLGWIEDASRKRSDGIIALGPCMKKRLVSHGIPAHLIHVVENWADGSRITPAPYRTSGPLNILYSGNFGRAHDIDTILGAIRHFENDPRFIFTFAGGGVGKAELQKVCTEESILNVRFLPYCDIDHMEQHLAQADIGLVTQRPACIGTVVPSKVYGLAAAGRPILFIGPAEATPGLMIQRTRCGWQKDPGDVAGLIELLDRLSFNRLEITRAGERARDVFASEYDLPMGVANIAAALGLEMKQNQDAAEAVPLRAATSSGR